MRDAPQRNSHSDGQLIYTNNEINTGTMYHKTHRISYYLSE